MTRGYKMRDAAIFASAYASAARAASAMLRYYADARIMPKIIMLALCCLRCHFAFADASAADAMMASRCAPMPIDAAMPMKMLMRSADFMPMPPCC